ncbi:MAG: hypothetical protein IPK73_13450 [Candidatus Obscuribacter sp.]|nr:hypothetical protein [Candidatus Obscuribacter sp.]MBK9282035.1 hypothetical protein [Candidatus Obscuribacter sp.]
MKALPFVVEGEGLLPLLVGSLMKIDMRKKMPVLLNNFQKQYEIRRHKHQI